MESYINSVIKKFRKKFKGNLWKELSEGWVVCDASVESFLITQLEEMEIKIAEDICVLIDEIENKSQTNTLEEWKQYKAIRNAIRDKYVIPIK